jgi:hypothetical protein
VSPVYWSLGGRGDFDVMLLLPFCVRHVEDYRADLGLAEIAGVLVRLFALNGDVVFLSNLRILRVGNASPLCIKPPDESL